MAKILIVEDERIIALDLQSRLKRLGYEVSGATSSGEEALERAAVNRPDLVLMDITLKGKKDGVQTGKEFREKFHIPVIYLTAHDDDETMKRAKITHPFGYLVKPFQEKTLHRMIQMAMHNHRLERNLLISGRDQQRIGQDLHDGLCQELAGITLLLEVLEKRLSDKSLPEAREAAEIHKLVGQSIIGARMLSRGLLLPVALEVYDLNTALKDIATHAEKLTRISCVAECRQPVSIGDRTVTTHLYRIAQEAVTNAIKHARAKHVVIKLAESDGQIVLSISDDGIGIPDEAARTGGLGISVMNSRAEAIRASLTLERGAKSGTIITCTLSSSDAPKPRPMDQPHTRHKSQV